FKRWIHKARNVRLRRLRLRKAYWFAFSPACFAMRIVFLRRPEQTLAAFRAFLCLACEVTPRLTRAIEILLADTCELLTRNSRARAAGGNWSAVRQPVVLDVGAGGLEPHVRAALLAACV